MPSFSSSSIHLSSHFGKKRGEERMRRSPEPTNSNKSHRTSGGSTRKEDLRKVVIRYTECRKNHAASIGGYAVDGCREFMASGEDGTAAALLCAACTCHRSFHKRQAELDAPPLCDCTSTSSSSTSNSEVEN